MLQSSSEDQAGSETSPGPHLYLAGPSLACISQPRTGFSCELFLSELLVLKVQVCFWKILTCDAQLP